MKSTFLLHLIPVGATGINKTAGSLTFIRRGDTSPETAIVNFNGIVEHCSIGSMSFNQASTGSHDVCGNVSLSSGTISIHLVVMVEKQNLTGVVGGVAKYMRTSGDAVTLMTVHGHMLPHADGLARAGDRHGGNFDGEASNDPWEGNTGW